MSGQATAVPGPWASRDIGSPAIAGASSFDQASGTFSIDAAGADIWGTADQFHFVYQPLADDAVITARVDKLAAVHSWAKAGVMIRSSLNANAAHAYALVSGGNGAAFQRRRSDGGTSVHTSGSTAAAPLWVRLVRSGSTVTASVSSNGTNWTTIGSDTIALGATAYVGLAVTSHNVAQSTSAAVSSVTATGTAALPSPQQSQDIGAPAIAGSAAFSQGTYTVTSASRNVGGTADQFHFVYQPLTGDMDVSIRVVSFAGLPPQAKAGVMIRENLTSGSPHALAALSRDSGYLFQRRPAAGGTTVLSTAVAGATPGWVRLRRTGDLITAYRSLDGTTWTAIGSDSFPMAATVYVGIAVTSRDVAAATTATLANLIINQSLPPNQPPAATLSAPVTGATYLAPATIAVTASASDADGTVARVDFYNGTTLLGSDATAPYAITWSNVAAGTYTLRATAVDDAGATGSSATATVTVTANQIPTATLTSPADGASFTAPATVSLTASASDADGTVARVDFYNGSTLLGSDTTAPYTFAWTNVAAGSYALQATAVDNAGASGSSSVASVTVNAANQPPTVTLTAPANGATFTAPATIALSASVSDPENQVNRVEFYRGTTLLGTDTTAPFAFTWSSVPAGSYSLTAVAYDGGGVSAQSAAVGVTITPPNQPPAVALTAPANGATYTAPASIAIAANASDPENQLSRVEFYSGTTLLGTDTAAPYTFTWSAVPAGSYALQAVAYDAGGLTGTTAASVSVTVVAATALPPGQQAVDIGGPAIAGSTTYSNGSYQIHAGGVDIWNTADQFHYVYQQMSGDIDVSARIVSQSFSDEWAKAGVMIRGTLDAASPNVATTLSAGRGYAFQRRLTFGSPTLATNVTTGAPPGWVRITRTGALVTAYRSSDGQNWIVIGTDSIDMPNSVYVGIAVTSHNTTVATDAVVDNFRGTAIAPVNQPPAVSLTAPPNGATYTALASITMTATASDADGSVARVDFYNGSTLLGSDTTAPYAFSWSNVAAGTYVLKATAVDNVGATGSSATATITVTAAGNQIPTATLTAPANGASFIAPATVSLAASASDADGTVARVDFYNGSTLLGSDTTAPYSFTWSNVAAGTYALKATAVDNAGASGSSSQATVTVNVANQPPTVTLTAPANGATYAAPASLTLTANAADANGSVARVEFYNGGAILGTDTTAPYAFAWSGVPVGTYALRAVAYDNVGASTTSATATITVGAALPPPTAVVFQASTDHATVTSYLLEIFANGADPNTATPVASSDLGKPTPGANGDITVNRATLFSGLAPGTYVLTVSSIGPDGTSRSASVTFTR